MGCKNKVLFLGHEASRTGAPMVLLELIKWFNLNSSINSSVLLKRGGEMEADYRAVAPTRNLEQEVLIANQGIHRKVLRRLRLTTVRQPDFAAIYPPEEYSVLYANTIDTCDLALQLAGPRRRLVHHIHELSYVTSCAGATDRLKRAVPVTDVYIAVSQAVREYLETIIGVPSRKIQVVHEFPIAAGKEDRKVESRQVIRRQLEIPDSAFVIGMCGFPQWRKGSDLFVQLALYMKRHFDPGQCHFVWLGGDASSQREALHDVLQTGLQNICHFVPAVADPEDYFSAFDVFALTSREDPFPVAMLEAAASGLPIVCFAGAGGAIDLIEHDAGLIVPYLDVSAMANACVDLLKNENRRKQLGEHARVKVKARYMLDQQAQNIRLVIEKAMS